MMIVAQIILMSLNFGTPSAMKNGPVNLHRINACTGINVLSCLQNYRCANPRCDQRNEPIKVKTGSTKEMLFVAFKIVTDSKRGLHVGRYVLTDIALYHNKRSCAMKLKEHIRYKPDRVKIGILEVTKMPGTCSRSLKPRLIGTQGLNRRFKMCSFDLWQGREASSKTSPQTSARGSSGNSVPIAGRDSSHRH